MCIARIWEGDLAKYANSKVDRQSNFQCPECAPVGRNGISEPKSRPELSRWKDMKREYGKSGGRRKLVLCEDRWKDLWVCVREVNRKDLELSL